jgi:hypothetical protein
VRPSLMPKTATITKPRTTARKPPVRPIAQPAAPPDATETFRRIAVFGAELNRFLCLEKFHPRWLLDAAVAEEDGRRRAEIVCAAQRWYLIQDVARACARAQSHNS